MLLRSLFTLVGGGFSYVGHGAGARFLDSQAVLKRQMRAASLLFGCSSAALAVRGEQEGQGIVLNYLMAGWWEVSSGTFICFVCVKEWRESIFFLLCQSICAGKLVGRDGPRYRPVHKSPFGSLVCCWVWSSSPGLYGLITPGHTPEAPHRSGTCGVRITSPLAVGERMLMPLNTCGNGTIFQDFI